jgi:hypothetical protein
LSQNDSERLLELINSPPPTVPSLEDSFKMKLSLSLISLDSPALSEGLTSPIKPNKRRSNVYVKERPQSRELPQTPDEIDEAYRQRQARLNRSSAASSSIDDSTTGPVTTSTAVTVHHVQSPDRRNFETAL